jgi:hypothetical protein
MATTAVSLAAVEAITALQ